MSGLRHWFSRLVRDVSDRHERFLVARAQTRRARDLATLRRESEFLKDLPGDAYEGWVWLQNRGGRREGMLRITRNWLIFQPPNKKHRRRVAVSEISSVRTTWEGFTVATVSGDPMQVVLRPMGRHGPLQWLDPIAPVWVEAIRAMVAQRTPAFERPEHEPEPVEAALNQVFDVSALGLAPVREGMPFRALGYPFAGHLIPSQEDAIRAVCRERKETALGLIQVEYDRDRWEIAVRTGFYVDTSMYGQHALVSLTGEWGILVTSEGYAVLACESAETLAMFEREMPEFKREAATAFLGHHLADDGISELTRHLYGPGVFEMTAAAVKATSGW